MIKSLIIISAFAFFALNAEAASVKGYVKHSSGKYVQPHLRTKPDKSYYNNYSSKGNYSPTTGKEGTVSLEKYQQRKLKQQYRVGE